MSLKLKISEILKSAFPKPVIPQKRYILLLVTLVYLIAKVYVENTPDKYDDELLEAAHDLVVQIVADAKENDTFSIVNSEDASVEAPPLTQHYGESA